MILSKDLSVARYLRLDPSPMINATKIYMYSVQKDYSPYFSPIFTLLYIYPAYSNDNMYPLF